MLARNLKTLLDGNGIHYEVLQHPRVFTAQGMAAALHVSGREVAKTVILWVDGGYAMAVVPAHRRVDLARFREAAGARAVALATEDEMAALFRGCELGAEPPVGGMYGIPVWVDSAITQDATIVFNAGSHAEAMRLAYEDYVKVAHPVVASFARD